MIIDVSAILKEYGGVMEIHGSADIPGIAFMGNSYDFKSPFEVSGTVSNNGTTLILNADCRAVMATQCARCAKDIDVEIRFTISETLMQGEEKEDEFSEVILFDGYQVDMDEIVMNNFIMNVDSRYLCSEDCKGICPKCGADLNLGECGCDHEEIDPRWAALADIIKNKD